MTLRDASPRDQLPTNLERERDERAMALSPDLDPAGLDDPRWLLAERILATPDFRRSPRLADFLHYIVRATLQGHSTLLNEQHIGEVVFGRAPDYDASADTIVRSHALRLRRRLEQYAARAGAHDDLRLTIPRGAYVPTFLPTAQADPPPDLTADPVPRHSPESSPEPPSVGLRVPDSPSLPDPLHALVRSHCRYRLAFLLTLLVLIACTVSAFLLLHARHPASESSGSHHALWSQLFTQD